MALKRHLC